MKNEAILNCKDFEWNSFISLLGLSSVLKRQVLSYYPYVGDVNLKTLFKRCNITPKTRNINQKCFRKLFLPQWNIWYFFQVYKISVKSFCTIVTHNSGKKSYPSQTSSASKKICLKLPKIENLAFTFNKGKQSKLKLKPCLKLLCASSKVPQYTSSTVSLNSDCVKLNTLTLPICSSSTVTSASRSSFNFSSGNTAINLD